MGVPKNKLVHVRTIGQVPYNGGGRQTLDLDRDGVLLGLALKFNFTITNGATGPSGPLFQTLARIAKRIEVIANGRDTVWSVAGYNLAARVTYEDHAVPYGMEAAVVLTNSAVTNYEVILPLDFELPGGRRPDDTGLDTRGLQQLSLAVTWGAISDFFTTPNAGTALSNVTCEVEGRYLINPRDGDVYLVRALDEAQRQLAGSNNAFDFVVDRGTGLVYRSFAIITTRNDVGISSMLDNGSIRLEAGSFVYRNTKTKQLLARNRRETRMAPPPGVAGSPFITGLYFMDLLHNGELVTGLDTTNLDADLKLIFDATYTSGTEMLTIQREAVRPLKVR